MKKINVYNSSIYPVTIILYEEHITMKPKDDIHIETGVWFGDDNFKIISETEPNQHWIEAYMGRYNQNLILRLETE